MKNLTFPSLIFQGSVVAIATTVLTSTVVETAQGATVTYTLEGTVTSGPLLTQTYSGIFSFDDASLTGSGDEFLTVDTIFVNFNGSTFTKADATVPPEVSFFEGDFLGLSFSVSQDTPPLSFSFIPGFFDVTESFVSYEENTLAGDGNVIYSQISVPESSSILGLFGFGLYGLAVFFKQKSPAKISRSLKL